MSARQRGKAGDFSARSFDAAEAVQHLRGADATLAKVIDAVGPCRLELKTSPTLFHALAESIVYQQLNGKAAATIFGRVSALYPGVDGGFGPEHILKTGDDALRAAGLSRSKLLALRDLAARTAAGELPTLAEAQGMDDEAIIERLTVVRGIGRWTAEMLLIFRLGRPDVLPLGDYGVQQGFAIAYKKPELPSKEVLEKRGRRWRPFRSVASWYLWRALERSKK